jgi:hypothetical protein
MILTRKQLEDIRTCSSHRCSECSFIDDCNCGAKAVVAETALELMDEMERMKQEVTKIGKWPVSINSTFFGMRIVGTDFEHRTIEIKWESESDT